jgi:hypothetical protein
MLKKVSVGFCTRLFFSKNNSQIAKNMIYPNFRWFLSLTIILVTMMSFTDPNFSQSKQGISGTILRLSGDQMPTIDTTSLRTKPEPIKTTIWIFSGRIPAQGTNWPVAQAQKHPHLIKQISSDSQGNFLVELPSGEYTLLAQYDDNLYLNNFLGDGSYGTVQVTNGQIVNIQLINTEKAYF